jgi:hypothetical protein
MNIGPSEEETGRGEREIEGRGTTIERYFFGRIEI